MALSTVYIRPSGQGSDNGRTYFYDVRMTNVVYGDTEGVTSNDGGINYFGFVLNIKGRNALTLRVDGPILFIKGSI